MAPGATSGVPLISKGSSTQPAFGTALVAGGGTGVTSWTDTNSLVATGTSSTGAVQDIASVATGQVLSSAGTSTLPTWTAAPSVTSITLSGGTALSTYAEGTFTPGIAFGGASVGITYTLQTGSYTKIGNVVFFAINIVLSNKGSSTGTATCTSLPFVSVDNTTRQVLAATQNFTFNTGYLHLTWFSGNGNATLTFSQYSPTANLINATDAGFANNTGMRFSGFYYV